MKVWLTFFKNGNNLTSTKNSNTNESNKFIYQFTYKVILKIQITKTLDWLIYVFVTHRKTLNQCIATINLKYLPLLGMMNSICLMVLIQSQASRITLDLSSKNTKL